MAGSKTCYVHSFGHFKGVPWHKNSTIQFIISLVLSALLFAYSEWRAFTLSDFTRALQEADIENSASLLRRYSSGYILFGIYGDQFVESHSNRLSNDYKINWKSAKILSVDQKSIKFQFPDIEMGPYKFIDNEWTLGRGEGPGRRKLPIGILPEVVWLEVLKEYEEGSIIVLGFEPDPNW